MGFWGLVRTIFVIWLIYQIVQYIRRAQENAQRRGFEEGRRQAEHTSGSQRKAEKKIDDNVGEYVDFEEIKD
ncbi:MAG: hypothetical protein RL226_1325 [Bacteroidota bacterium]|jgi:flagellar biosynthesis/type III secretory pathway M-ring protein FliF/YscJ